MKKMVRIAAVVFFFLAVITGIIAAWTGDSRWSSTCATFAIAEIPLVLSVVALWAAGD